MCTASDGRAELLEKKEPNHGLRFVHIPGSQAPSFAAPGVIPSQVNGLPIDAFMAGHPRGFGEYRFGDLDGDGDLDVVAARGTIGMEGVSVFRNNGDGTFSQAGSLAGGYTARLCDVDRDGDLDIVSLVRYPKGTPRGLHINDGTGRFTDEAAVRLPLVNEVQDQECLDLDGDGAPDLLAATWYEPDRLLLNDGRGFFKEGPLPPPGIATPSRLVVAGDLDGDGRDDAVIAGESGTSRLLMNRDGGLVSRIFDVGNGGYLGAALGDFDADGDLDLALAGRDGAHLLVNDGRGVFERDAAADFAVREVPESYVHFLTLGDYDGDGDLDWETEGGSPPVLFNTRIHPVGTDVTQPRLAIREPVDGTVAHVSPTLRVAFADVQTGIDVSTLRVMVNGQAVELKLGLDSAAADPWGPNWRTGENLVVLEARDMAGNGHRRTSSFRLQIDARPFAIHLEVQDANGLAANVFERGEIVRFVTRFDNASGATLSLAGGCSFPAPRVFDSGGSIVWTPELVCDRLASSLAIGPCSSVESQYAWPQTRWFTGASVPPGTYEVEECVERVLTGLEPPPSIRVTVR